MDDRIVARVTAFAVLATVAGAALCFWYLGESVCDNADGCPTSIPVVGVVGLVLLVGGGLTVLGGILGLVIAGVQALVDRARRRHGEPS